MSHPLGDPTPEEKIDDPADDDLLAGFDTARQPLQRESGSYQVISPFAEPTERDKQ